MNSHQNQLQLGPLRPLLRSLLQKAVRRGYPDLSKKIAFILASRGDSAWLHSRTGVIAFEECWPCANILGGQTPSAVILSEVASAVKKKDAAGLGSLAHAAAEGDATAIEQAYDPIAVKIVAAALRRPESFFNWAVEKCINEEQVAIVLAARLFFSKASWPWDKAFMAAGAYLSLQVEIPQMIRSEKLPQASFPYWTAIDKHTPQGKIALRKVALELCLSERQLQWISFYLESAMTNASEPSPWWENETKWRFASLGLSMESAKEMWEKVSPHVEHSVQYQANHLLHLVNSEDKDIF